MKGRFAPDLIGKVYGNLTVIGRAENTPYKKSMWICRCICGKEKTIMAGNLIKGTSTSCGCIRTKMLKERATHGMCYTKTYRTWSCMKTRCTNKRRTDYKDYGGRGIGFDKSWSRFVNFLKDMGERPEGKELDRIDNTKGYSKENCRWVTRSENMQNTRRKKPLHKGDLNVRN
jgi:hypothetical protein